MHREDQQPRLSNRERETTAYVAQALSNKEIGCRLGITEGTVKQYLHSVFEKLGVKNRTKLALRWREMEARRVA
jgi:two-component system nitrate/nitrite response regulator NarL